MPSALSDVGATLAVMAQTPLDMRLGRLSRALERQTFGAPEVPMPFYWRLVELLDDAAEELPYADYAIVRDAEGRPTSGRIVVFASTRVIVLDVQTDDVIVVTIPRRALGCLELGGENWDGEYHRWPPGRTIGLRYGLDLHVTLPLSEARPHLLGPLLAALLVDLEG